MRFSIRWMLAIVAYVAVVVAVMVTGSNRLVDLIWAVSWLAICYAAVFAAIGDRRQRAMAVGFPVLSIAHLIGLQMKPHHMLPGQLCEIAGYNVARDGDIWVRGRIDAKATELKKALPAANAISTLVLGFLGCFIGRIAYPHAAEPHRRD
jgi:hypothetical protein